MPFFEHFVSHLSILETRHMEHHDQFFAQSFQVLEI